MNKPKPHISRILALPRAAKRVIVLLVDTSLCVFTVWLAYYLRLGEFIKLTEKALIPLFSAIVIALPIFMIFGLYRTIFRYSGWPALMPVTRAIAVYGLFYASIFTAIGITGVPRTIGIIQPILLLLFVGISRSFAGFWLGDQYRILLKKVKLRKVLIYGAGKSGRQLADALSNSFEMQVVGFLDDDERLQGHVLNALPIYNPIELPRLSETSKISDVLLAMPNINRKRRNEVLMSIRNAQVMVRTLPSVSDLAQGKVTVSDLRELDIDDLLVRETVSPNHILLAKNINGKVVMVTGAGGSIGSELCRQIIALGPKKLLLVEQNEFSLYTLQQELEKTSGSCELIPLLASVQDANRMKEIIFSLKPNTVYHTAAYKHVPLVEQNLGEGIKNNVLGTLITVRACITENVENFVLISTDKAVRPTNVMGASKRLAEMFLQAHASKNPSTKLSIVRFGNVLGSSGSVVPKFRQQIKDGGPITITHSDITRFFMTIPEASQLVIQAGAMATGGDVFVLDMGEPVKIFDLARRMIELSGLSVKDDQHPEGDIEIAITSLRPGEKLYEELLTGKNPQTTSHSRILKANESFVELDELEKEIAILISALNDNEPQKIIRIIAKLVPGYEPSQDILDLAYTGHG